MERPAVALCRSDFSRDAVPSACLAGKKVKGKLSVNFRFQGLRSNLTNARVGY